MKRLFSIENSLEAVAALLALTSILGVLQTFIIGRHYVIPTMILMLAVLLGNLARFGVSGQRWAKHVLFWLFFLTACHTFFAIFWAAAPRITLEEWFLPVYGVAFVVLSGLCWSYWKKNELFR